MEDRDRELGEAEEKLASQQNEIGQLKEELRRVQAFRVADVDAAKADTARALAEVEQLKQDLQEKTAELKALRGSKLDQDVALGECQRELEGLQVNHRGSLCCFVALCVLFVVRN